MSINNAFRYVAENTNQIVMLFGDEENGNNFRTLLQNSLIGGYSSVLYSRYEKANETKIRPHQFHENARYTKRVITWDATAVRFNFDLFAQSSSLVFRCTRHACQWICQFPSTP